jgi:hypothetical protein
MDKFNFQVSIASGEVWSGRNAPKPDFGTEKMQSAPVLRFVISYPLTRPKHVEYVHEDGSPWSQRQFVEAVVKAYAEVYAEEGDDPGHLPGMLNRATSTGPYGIWGHDLGDLVLEGATKLDDGSWSLMVGS